MNLLVRRVVIATLGGFVILGLVVAIPLMYFVGWISREPSHVSEAWGEILKMLRDSLRTGTL